MIEMNTEDLTEENIEGVIFKTAKNEWVAFFNTGDKEMRVRVDYCPWCGKILRASEKGHSH